MTEIILYEKDSNEISSLVNELKKQGYQIGKDFDFWFAQASWNNFSGEAVTRKHTRFVFYNKKLGTFFALKYL